MDVKPTGPRYSATQLAALYKQRNTARIGLAAQIKNLAVKAEDLYGWGHTAVALAVTGRKLMIGPAFVAQQEVAEAVVEPNLTEAALIFSRAAKGNFPYWFNSEGRVYNGRG